MAVGVTEGEKGKRNGKLKIKLRWRGHEKVIVKEVFSHDTMNA